MDNALRRMIVADQVRESLAALEHEQWAHWMRYMLANLTPENIEKWKEQAEIPYNALSEKEKDSDREWADRALATMHKLSEGKLNIVIEIEGEKATIKPISLRDAMDIEKAQVIELEFAKELTPTFKRQPDIIR